MCLDLFNMLDELLELLAESQQKDIALLKAQCMLASETSKNKINKEFDTKMLRVLKFLKVVTLFSSNIQYFNSIEVIL